MSGPNSPRCPKCGVWLSTRYSASRPHNCETAHRLKVMANGNRMPIFDPATGEQACPPLCSCSKCMGPEQPGPADWPVNAFGERVKPYPDAPEPGPAVGPWFKDCTQGLEMPAGAVLDGPSLSGRLAPAPAPAASLGGLRARWFALGGLAGLLVGFLVGLLAGP